MQSTTRRMVWTALLLMCFGHASDASGMCTPTPTTVCLAGDVMSISVDWTSETGSGAGLPFAVATSSTGFFTLDDPGTVEVMAQAFDACSINGNYWVFLSVLSTHELTVHVTNTQTATSTSYNFPGGSVPQPITDTAALACGPRRSPATTSLDLTSLRMPTELALVGGRFRVSIEWETAGGASAGQGFPIPLTDSSGAFWYFDTDNPQLLLSIEPNATGDAYRFVSNAVSSVGQTITVRDTCDDSTSVYASLPTAIAVIVDDDIFPIACGTHVFANDFESGHVGFWSFSTH
ncbi:MAG: hypothetical protein AAGE94_18535 [Acidobacteriota bacterium]